MNTLELALKKQRLIIKSAALRASLAEDAAPLRPLFSAADRVVAGIHWVQSRPQAVLAAVAALAIIRPRLLWRWGRRSLVLWKAWQKVRNLSRP